jgi:hypothetical protein
MITATQRKKMLRSIAQTRKALDLLGGPHTLSTFGQAINEILNEEIAELAAAEASGVPTLPVEAE